MKTYKWFTDDGSLLIELFPTVYLTLDSTGEEDICLYIGSPISSFGRFWIETND